MGRRAKGSSDDLKMIQGLDFSGGLNTMNGPFSLGLNECIIGTKNVIGVPGRCFYIGGFQMVSTLPSRNPDNSYQFYDSTGTKHWMVWCDGNLYDTVSGGYLVIEAGCYTAGEQVGRVDQNGVLYWCTNTVPVRYYNGAGVGATTNGPKGNYMTAFCGSLIVANPTPNASTRQPGAFIPSAVNDPNNWLTGDMQQVGTDFSGEISFIVPMGISAQGVPPSTSMIVGKTAGPNMFMYEGPIGDQIEKLISCPVSSLDAHSAVYVPSSQALGEVLFLGTDAQIWATNGITARMVTEKNLNYVFGLISAARSAYRTQRFFATYCDRYAYYYVDLGNNQGLLYKWGTDALFFVEGWPSGALFAGTKSNGFSANYCAAVGYGTAGLYELGMDSVDFDGVNPTIQYVSAYLHGGNPELQKEFDWIALAMRNIGASYSVTAETMPFSDNTSLTSAPLIFNDPANAAVQAGALWDVAEWDVATWAPDPNTGIVKPAMKHGMLAAAVSAAQANEWIPAGARQPLRSPAASLTIGWNDNGLPPAFDICGFQLRYNPRSNKGAGGTRFNPQDGNTFSGNDPWIGAQTT